MLLTSQTWPKPFQTLQYDQHEDNDDNGDDGGLDDD